MTKLEIIDSKEILRCEANGLVDKAEKE